ncbi:MAG: putative manganese-dependent inorganic diphosphatase [Faecousia sp.]
MDPIYVTGHRNPDTDSIVAAIAYAYLRNALGDREFRPACLGRASDETQIVLNRFGFQQPDIITSMYTQVRDLAYDKPPILGTAVTEDRAWSILREQRGSIAVPVANEDGTLYGMLAREDVASYNMELTGSSYLDEVPLCNVLSVLEGQIINEAGEETDTLSGEVVIALPESGDSCLFQDRETIAICGNQPEMIRRALEMNINCLILCRAELAAEFQDIPTSTCIIFTPFDAYRVSRLLFQSTPIGRICRTRDLTCFHLDDRLDDVRELVLKHRASCYPILDEEEKVVGVLTRYHLIRPKRKRVVLVDHNEAAQSVPGLEEAEIMEIIDHHRLADIQTGHPIYVRNEPVGSTNTIIASMYFERGLIPPKNIAGIMAAAILSDTVMFKSPTATERDKRTAERMARIANISLEELGKAIFSASLEGKTARDLLFSDYKEFHIAGHDLAVSQITCVDSVTMLDRKDEFLKEMRAVQKKEKLEMMLLMITDVLLEGSQIVCVGDENIITQAFGTAPKENVAFLQGVMSRKKQVIPSLSALWG